MSESERVPIDSLTPFEGNARRGNVPAIMESLRANGQYRTLVVRKETREILAGNHTWKAAQELGWTEIDVSWVSCDTQTARRIVLADNRTSDQATYDEDALLELLRSLPDLEGTGYETSDLDKLDGLFSEAGAPLPESDNEAQIVLEAGQFRATLDPDIHAAWLAALIGKVGEKSRAQITELRRRLDLPTESKRKKLTEKPAPIKGNAAILETTTEEIGSLIPHPDNAREGDVGAISESLTLLGQYKPIVVNQRTREILAGNHTWLAAVHLGWKTIDVSWVDADEVAAKKILLADNRTSDLAFYHDEQLLELLKSTGNLSGTGYDGDDLDALAMGGSGRPMGAKRAYLRVGEIKFSTAQEVFLSWIQNFPEGNELVEIVTRLDMPPDVLILD